jgi:hypothetical protein
MNQQDHDRVAVVAVHRLEPSVEIVVLETNTVEEILVDGGEFSAMNVVNAEKEK